MSRERNGRTYVYSITSKGVERYYYLIFKRNEEIIKNSTKKRCSIKRTKQIENIPIEIHISEPHTHKNVNIFEYYHDKRYPVTKVKKIDSIKPITNTDLTRTKNTRIFQDVQKCRIIKKQKVESIWDNVQRCKTKNKIQNDNIFDNVQRYKIIDENDDLEIDSQESEEEEEELEEEEEDVVSLFERLSLERCRIENQYD